MRKQLPNPSASDVRAARHNAGLSGEKASALVYVSSRMWRMYEAGDSPMSPGLFELFQIKTGQIPVPGRECE